ncbi:FAD-dependent monooxygenase [Blastococcus sp. TF02A-26]|uniref:FAD-dependent monooxygenase n=1 Tax=Blastococcus sp. TF02A-26 TaxID=2250577 RepID=UPI0018F36B78|nr:FAD-dependent monooxygenase [Blastococcus sp. TF02A-26]
MSAARVVIAGGGIGGLAAAAFLSRAGLEVSVHEQTAEFREIGAGLVVAPNLVRLLRRLGLAARLADVGVRLEVGWEFRRWQDGRVLFAQQLERSAEMYGEDTWVVHRADLLELLRSAVPAEAVHLGQRATGVEQDDDGIRLQLADGTAVEGDAVIGADGIHSVLRGAVTTPGPPRYSGLCAWRSLVPADAAPELARRPAQTLWLGPGRHLVHYPVSSGRLVNLVAFTPAGDFDVESWESRGRVEDLAAEFAGWDPRLTDLVAGAGEVGRWALLDRDPIPTWTAGRLALLGDAAHPMVPFFAQGAGQAVEDAAALAVCLSDPGATVPEALARYQAVRAPRATRVQTASRGRQGSHHLPDGPEQQTRDAAFAGDDPLAHNEWLYSYDAEEAARTAR